MKTKIEKIIDFPAFSAMLNLTEHLGPFHPNPKIDKLYRCLRILGMSEEDTKKFIMDTMSTKHSF